LFGGFDRDEEGVKRFSKVESRASGLKSGLDVGKNLQR